MSITSKQANIQGIRIRNFGCLKDITLGRLPENCDSEPLGALTALIGQNGTGKSTLIDALSFLADSLKIGIDEACYLRNRGGFNRLHSQGTQEDIVFEVCYQSTINGLMHYALSINSNASGRPFITHERLSSESQAQFEFDGVDLTDITDIIGDERLRIDIMGAVKSNHSPHFLEISALVANFYVSRFDEAKAKLPPIASAQPQLNEDGGNLANVVNFLQKNARLDDRLSLNSLTAPIFGIRQIDTQESVDGRLLLRFFGADSELPFHAAQASSGTLKLLAYLVLLENAASPRFICLDNPVSNLHPKVIPDLVASMHAHQDARQVLVATHNPLFIDNLEPSEVWLFEKQEDGFSVVTRVSDIKLVKNMTEEGIPLGGLWFSDYFDDNTDNDDSSPSTTSQ